MNTEKIAERISDILPDRPQSINAELCESRSEKVQESAETIAKRQTARELAILRYREKARLENEQRRLQARIDAGIEPGRTAHQQRKIEEQEATVAVIEALEEQNNSGAVAKLIRSNMPTKVTPEQAAVLQTTTRRDVVKLLSSLNINLNLQLTKNDTANLLACLLTCNETQLQALYNNKKVPVAIKTVIKRLLADAKDGYMGTVESLWDRVFGKAGMAIPTAQPQEERGIIPGAPISREAYIILRDTIIK